ncbi:MoaD/ThiS family protein [Komagataeibacter sucrofermentans]|uniref:Molybdopterin synthase sulfur carrier subunit n=1 Tax=Komagataeibacter sucrofermentans TaxID=1053551 RepID=A0A318QEM1_9PROT|nr:MoaD/ThiS family protein [Komagataeibacter sucrofermentans]PYD78057.1 molybdopterin synthase sulfur carrier subunit [Komagataeibacter sucrofermentans]GBQ51333.1 molybdopterin converting factor small subunit [Komagataeibacter sucrofermentans DSM 15973]
MLTIELQYFAQLQDEAGRAHEIRQTPAPTAAILYDELRDAYGFALEPARMRVAINSAFAPWDQPLREGDHVAFIPPVTGG